MHRWKFRARSYFNVALNAKGKISRTTVSMMSEPGSKRTRLKIRENQTQRRQLYQYDNDTTTNVNDTTL